MKLSALFQKKFRLKFELLEYVLSSILIGQATRTFTDLCLDWMQASGEYKDVEEIPFELSLTVHTALSYFKRRGFITEDENSSTYAITYEGIIFFKIPIRYYKYRPFAYEAFVSKLDTIWKVITTIALALNAGFLLWFAYRQAYPVKKNEEKIAFIVRDTVRVIQKVVVSDTVFQTRK